MDKLRYERTMKRMFQGSALLGLIVVVVQMVVAVAESIMYWNQ